MKKIEMLKIWWNKIFNSTVKIDSMDKLNHIIEGKEKSLLKIKNGYQKSRGELKTIEDKISENEKVLNDIVAWKNSLLEQYGSYDNFPPNKKKDVENLAIEYDNIEKELELFENNKQSISILIEKMETVKIKMESDIHKLKLQMQELKIKSDFSKTISEYSDILKDTTNTGSIEELKDEINNEFNTSNIIIEDDITEKTLDGILEESRNENLLDDFLKK